MDPAARLMPFHSPVQLSLFNGRSPGISSMLLRLCWETFLRPHVWCYTVRIKSHHFFWAVYNIFFPDPYSILTPRMVLICPVDFCIILHTNQLKLTERKNKSRTSLAEAKMLVLSNPTINKPQRKLIYNIKQGKQQMIPQCIWAETSKYLSFLFDKWLKWLLIQLRLFCYSSVSKVKIKNVRLHLTV